MAQSHQSSSILTPYRSTHPLPCPAATAHISPNLEQSTVVHMQRDLAPKTTATSGESEAAVIVPVEAQGIEPWSELASSTASTCVDNCLYRRPYPASCQPCVGLSPECLTHRPGARR